MVETGDQLIETHMLPIADQQKAQIAPLSECDLVHVMTLFQENFEDVVTNLSLDSVELLDEGGDFWRVIQSPGNELNLVSNILPVQGEYLKFDGLGTKFVDHTLLHELNSESEFLE